MKWETRALGEICELSAGVTLGRKLPSTGVRKVPYLRVANVKAGRLDLTEIKQTEATEAEIQRGQLRFGDILLTEGGDPDKLGRGTFWRDELPECILQNHVFRLRFDLTRFDSEFLSHQFGSEYGKAYFLAHAKQTTGIATINRTVLSAFPVMCPPLPEQKRVAARLREQLAEVEKARDALQSQLQTAEKIRAAALRAAYGEDAQATWPKIRLGDVANITAGVTLGRKLPPVGMRKVPYLRVANVKDGRLDLSRITATDAKESEIENLRLHYGDLLLTEGGDPDKLGRGTFWQDELPECIHQNHVFRLRFDLAKFDPAFLAFQFGSEYGKAYFFAHAKQTTGIATINRKVLDQFPLLCPTFAVQQATVTKLTESLAGTQFLIADIKARLEAVEKLPAALLREVFNYPTS